MIVHIAGTSGSGKSHLVRGLLASAKYREQVSEAGRSAPLGYILRGLPGVTREVHVVGAYEAPSSGGCDTFGGDGRVERLYSTILNQHNQERHVVYEGIMMMNHTRGLDLLRQVRGMLTVIQLKTPLAECILAVGQRRVAAGKPADFNTKNTEDTFRRTDRYCFKLRQAGGRVIGVSRADAPGVLMEALRCP